MKPGDILEASVRLAPKSDRREEIEFVSFETYTAPTKRELEDRIREHSRLNPHTQGSFALEKRDGRWVAILTTPKACTSEMDVADAGRPSDIIRCSLVSGEHTFDGDDRIHKNPKRDAMWRESAAGKRRTPVLLPSVGRTVHYYGWLPAYAGEIPPTPEEYPRYRAAFPGGDFGPFAALVVDVGPEPTTVTLKITDRSGRDHVRANVEYGDPGWMWPPRV